MRARLVMLALFVGGILTIPSHLVAGVGYVVTSKVGDKTITYQVQIGGGRTFERLTAFDPKTKKFAYYDWERDKPAPKPVFEIFDHRTGENVPLFKFPGVEYPLPTLPAPQGWKACPITGDKHFKFKVESNYD